jgi:hypothetical protein
VHGTVIRSVGYVLLYHLRVWTGATIRENTSLGQLIFLWVAGYALILPLCLWLADLFYRYVDVTSVNFARTLEQRLKRPQEEGKGHENGKLFDHD